MLRFAWALSAVLALQAQLVSDTSAIPRTEGKPPVVFVNGYQAGCSSEVSFDGTFGNADEVMQRDGRVSLFFNNCTVGGNDTAIETLGNAFRDYLNGLRYRGGEQVPVVDVVAHSMGGLIVRSYLSGKQTEPGVFMPPAAVRIRKLAFLGTPHFGTPVTDNSGTKQIQQLAPAGEFVFDLATWNQGQEDLRGVEAISVLGSAGVVSLSGWERQYHDSTVSLTSGSLAFTYEQATRVLPYCHTTGGLATFACGGVTRAIANLTDDQHDTARILKSFLNGTQEWRTIGQAASANSFLSNSAGLAVRWRNSEDQPVQIASAGVRRQGSTGSFETLERQGDSVAYDELIAAAPYEIHLMQGQTSITAAYEPAPGAFRTLTLKTGPMVAAVAPVFSAVTPRAVAPGMFVSLYGTFGSATLQDTQVSVGGRALTVQYVGPNQINAILPEDASGLMKLTVRTPLGQHTINALVEPAVPSLFASAVKPADYTLVTRDAPAVKGSFILLYLTGLGTTERREGLDWAIQQPEVALGNERCEVSYAGRAPGWTGLDQINCRIPESAPADDLMLTVRSGSRVSNVIVVPVR